jgi:hypothetical protein
MSAAPTPTAPNVLSPLPCLSNLIVRPSSFGLDVVVWLIVGVRMGPASVVALGEVAAACPF